jgi:AmmeMemoRadiSam system protein B
MTRRAAAARSGASVRHPAVAGSFYPADPVSLASIVDSLVDRAEMADEEAFDAAYIVPHAGYRYSGPTAAKVYARLKRHASQINRVVLLGPAHRVSLKGCAVPSAQRWLTPLGEVAIDPTASLLVCDGHAVADDRPHAAEHSLEVQLPFLQRVVPHASVLPVVVGVSTSDDVVVTIAAAVGAAPSGTVVLCSTDLSHYLPDDEARRQDARTAQAVLELAPDRIGVRDACGVFALRGLVAWARHSGLRSRQLALDTSADATGDTFRVVGYPAFAFALPLAPTNDS